MFPLPGRHATRPGSDTDHATSTVFPANYFNHIPSLTICVVMGLGKVKYSVSVGELAGIMPLYHYAASSSMSRHSY